MRLRASRQQATKTDEPQKSRGVHLQIPFYSDMEVTGSNQFKKGAI
jgi:hypothetical protein